MSGKTYIGTSGWNYKHWLGPFYPEKLRAAEMLKFYAHHFNTVELNHSFYHLPTVKRNQRMSTYTSTMILKAMRYETRWRFVTWFRSLS